MFILTKVDGLTVDGRTYPAGAVVEAHKSRVEDLVRRKHAEPHPGPASEPETAVSRTAPERASRR